MRMHMTVAGAILAMSAAARAQPFCTRPDHRCVLYGGDGGPYAGAAYVAQWYEAYCPRGGPCHIDGIFFDVGPSVASSVTENDQKAYYQSLYQAVTHWPGATGKCGPTGATHP